MKLKITRVTSADHGIYHCVAKNDLDVTKGSFIVDGLSYHTSFARYNSIINNTESLIVRVNNYNLLYITLRYKRQNHVLLSNLILNTT